jgi:hypothetical protein
MHGVVSLLDNSHYRLIEDLWAELSSRSVDASYYHGFW